MKEPKSISILRDEIYESTLPPSFVASSSKALRSVCELKFNTVVNAPILLHNKLR